MIKYNKRRRKIKLPSKIITSLSNYYALSLNTIKIYKITRFHNNK